MQTALDKFPVPDLPVLFPRPSEDGRLWKGRHHIEEGRRVLMRRLRRTVFLYRRLFWNGDRIEEKHW